MKETSKEYIKYQFIDCKCYTDSDEEFDITNDIDKIIDYMEKECQYFEKSNMDGDELSDVVMEYYQSIGYDPFSIDVTDFDLTLKKYLKRLLN